MVNRRVTLSDIADRCGVSRATVSLVVRDSPQIPDSTKERVRAVMADMGYVYDRRAANLRGQRTFGLGLILTDIFNPALAELAMAMEDSSAEAGCSLMMGFSRDVRERQNELIRAMLEYRLDGVVLSPATGTTAADLQPLVNSGLPFVLVTRRIRGVDVDYIGPANSKAGGLLADHLASIGAKSVAFLGGFEGVSARKERLQGLRTGWKKNGLEWRPELSIVSNAGESGGREATKALLDRGLEPDAIVAYSDTVAKGVMLELRKNGIRPGIDVAVAGIDNDPFATHMRPSLTSVDTHMTIVGGDAVKCLLARIEDSSLETTKRLITTELCARESTEQWTPGGRSWSGAADVEHAQ